MREEEQRAYPRLDVIYPMAVEISQGIFLAKTENISEGSAFICCETPYEQEKTVHLSIELPIGSPRNLTAKVMWSTVCDDKMMPSGMGVRFEL